MSHFANRTEEFVYRICRQTFLSLWSYANPLRERGKELCDILIVCDPHVIIISVKEIQLLGTDSPTTWERWQRKAVDESVKQIAGAERFLNTASHVTNKDGGMGLPLPPPDRRQTHRVAVALGGRGEVPLVSGDLGKGYVHILTDESLELVLRELDTITDFTGYLSAKEAMPLGRQAAIIGSETDLLALYLLKGRSFPLEFDSMVITEGMWQGYTTGEDVKNRRTADEVSYVWDRVLELICQAVLQESARFGYDLAEAELVLRDMARENRFSRRQLGARFEEFLRLADVRARIVRGMSGVLYLFLKADHGGDRAHVLAELEGRCFMAKGMFQDAKEVIGVAVDTDVRDRTSSFMLYRLDKEDWGNEDQEQFEAMQQATGAFAHATYSEKHVEEYPQ